jgi:hypothetical protein
VDGISEIVGFDHIVLFVAPEAMLWAEGRADIHAGRDERVEAVREIARHRRGVSQKRDPLTLERPEQFRIGKQTVDTEQGH